MWSENELKAGVMGEILSEKSDRNGSDPGHRGLKLIPVNE
jgi:hypothetical protein